MSPASLTFLINQLLNEGSGNKTTELNGTRVEEGEKLIELFDWFFMPIVNADGYEFSWNSVRNTLSFVKNGGDLNCLNCPNFWKNIL